ncbi:hypothetical protein K2173_001340 [Erythroxylum novogranatense]|uniref:Uncharacterized protein n=1 Tax=Erythroxylum novogranatense TaxID=1862640 RepID=A0AAV8T4I4_9ROSI|nr:hypothetical protein K2173_001340 [Erythroxylum novogranatense]
MASTDPEGQPSKKGRTRKRDDEFIPPKLTVDDNGLSRTPLIRNHADRPSPAPPRGERPSIQVQCHASRYAQSHSGRRGPNRARATGTIPPSTLAQSGNIRRPVTHCAGQQGETARVGGSQFNILENVEALSEDLSQSGRQSHPFVFSGCGRRVAQSVVVQSEPNGTQPGPIPTEGPQNPFAPLSTEGPTNVATTQDQNPGSVDGPTGQTSLDRATGRGLGQLNPALIQLQPSTPENHLAIELQSHTEMVCDQGLLTGQPLGETEASGLEAGSGSLDLLPNPYVPIALPPEARPSADLPIPQRDVAMGQAQLDVDVHDAQEGGPWGTSP